MSTYEELSSKLKSILALKGSPVAVKLVRSKEEVPAGIVELGEKVRHCEMVQKARAGEVFYAPKEKHACAGGASALGLMETPANIRSGDFYFSLGRFSTKNAAKRTVDEVPRLDEQYYATVYAPLEKAAFQPDAIVIIGNPKQLLRIAQANIYGSGGRNFIDFSGIQSVCSDAVAEPILTGEICASFGCNGSRKNAKIEDDELIAGIPVEKLESTVAALEKVAVAK
ncbi:DUF169 domain-containing protein [Methanocella arvoryzae]|uniref:DUF169 domain-containing protein n=1 Tax=Methanocella arvoryzae (strain DSM 22066 / NBRC 105507 / MRE50) TaxID=351160 RepID=Q0W6I1_METAR|nr:DUF169 domain-containing protein [Methanocella arvoryzae]CAJ36012.1 conserved hypothetical protein [Methanocella arvoryzae MRE50]